MERYWIWLSTIKYVGPILQKNLLERFECPSKIFEAGETELAAVTSMNKRALKSIIDSKSLAHSEKILKECERKSIQILCFHDERYPAHAKNCRESPVVLYYRGTLKPISETVAVVGSRRCTLYGKRIAQDIGRELGENGVPLISGFAKGVDSYAQSSCVENGGYTIAFLANGVDLCYPKEQLALYERIISSESVLISSYPPGTKARPESFLQRNALISAWSNEVVIVEATAKSGALWTAQYAQSQGRSLYAVPNLLGVPEGEGTNRLISEGKAKVFLGIEESLISIRRLTKPKERLAGITQDPPQILSITQHQILAFLGGTPTSLLEVSRHFQIPEEFILEELLTLEFKGKIIIRGNLITKV